MTANACCAGFCLEEACQGVPACSDVAVPLICDLLGVVPGVCSQTHALLDLQQQLPLKGVGACLALPPQTTGTGSFSLLNKLGKAVAFVPSPSNHRYRFSLSQIGQGWCVHVSRFPLKPQLQVQFPKH